MLVLGRKVGERISIGENITVVILDIDRGRVKIGIEAPRDVPVFRQELLPIPIPAPPTTPAPGSFGWGQE